MNHRQLAESTTILRAPNGSRLHGVYLDGQDDRDEMAVFIPPPELVCGVDSLDHVISRDAAEGERSRPGERSSAGHPGRRGLRSSPAALCLSIIKIVRRVLTRAIQCCILMYVADRATRTGSQPHQKG